MNWIISDIHGYLNALKRLISKIEARDKNYALCTLGDVVNRGPDSYGVVEFLLNLAKERKCHYLLGNHDDVMLYLIDGQARTDMRNYLSAEPSKNSVIAWFNRHGLLQTEDCYRSRQTVPGPWYEMMPESHKDFFRNLKIAHVEDDWFACHSLYPTTTVPRDERFIPTEYYEHILWTRPSVTDINCVQYNKFGIFGHTPTQNYGAGGIPIINSRMAMIDGGCFIKNGRINALCVETKEVLFEYC